MAGTLVVNWTNGNPPLGLHRVAYRYPAWNGNAASAGYPAYIIVNTTCLTPGCSESIAIPVIVDEACEPLVIDGYVQSSCEAEDDVTGRVLFTTTFTPTSPCTAVTFTCNNPANCPVFNAQTGCHGLYGEISAKDYTEQFSFCYEGGVGGAQFALVSASATAAGYTYSDNTGVCCWECQEVTIQSDGSVPVRVQYEQCTAAVPPLVKASVNFAVLDTTPVTVCARPDSWATDEQAATTFTPGPPCT